MKIKIKEKTLFMWLDLAFEVINKNHISLRREVYTLSYKTIKPQVHRLIQTQVIKVFMISSKSDQVFLSKFEWSYLQR